MGLFTAKDARELSNSASIAGDLEVLSILEKIKEHSCKGNSCLRIDNACSPRVIDKLGELGYSIRFMSDSHDTSTLISW